MDGLRRAVVEKKNEKINNNDDDDNNKNKTGGTTRRYRPFRCPRTFVCAACTPPRAGHRDARHLPTFVRSRCRDRPADGATKRPKTVLPSRVRGTPREKIPFFFLNKKKATPPKQKHIFLNSKKKKNQFVFEDVDNLEILRVSRVLLRCAPQFFHRIVVKYGRPSARFM